MTAATTRPGRAREQRPEPSVLRPSHVILALLGGASAGALVLLLRANPGAGLAGVEPKGYWYLSRASGLVSFVLLWLATVLGLLITNKFARLWPGGPLAFDLHEYASSLGLLIGFFHGAILLGDRYTGYTLVQLLAPFGSVHYRPFWVGLGQIGGYLLAGIWLSSRLRLAIGQGWWRRIHFLSFAAFLLVLLHGMLAGTDSAVAGLRLLYWLSGGSVLWLTSYRVLLATAGRRRA